jgi:hypothetical protein
MMQSVSAGTEPSRPLRHDLAVVEQQDVVERKIRLHQADVLARDRIVEDELRPVLPERGPGLVIEIRPVGRRHDLQVTHR